MKGFLFKAILRSLIGDVYEPCRSRVGGEEQSEARRRAKRGARRGEEQRQARSKAKK